MSICHVWYLQRPEESIKEQELETGGCETPKVGSRRKKNRSSGRAEVL